MCYSTDMMKRFTYQREVEHLSTLPPEEKNKNVIEYMAKELERILKEYGDDPTRE